MAAAGAVAPLCGQTWHPFTPLPTQRRHGPATHGCALKSARNEQCQDSGVSRRGIRRVDLGAANCRGPSASMSTSSGAGGMRCAQFSARLALSAQRGLTGGSVHRRLAPGAPCRLAGARPCSARASSSDKETDFVPLVQVSIMIRVAMWRVPDAPPVVVCLSAQTRLCHGCWFIAARPWSHFLLAHPNTVLLNSSRGKAAQPCGVPSCVPFACAARAAVPAEALGCVHGRGSSNQVWISSAAPSHAAQCNRGYHHRAHTSCGVLAYPCTCVATARQQGVSSGGKALSSE